MKHRIIQTSLGLVIAAAIVGGFVYWQGLEVKQDNADLATSTTNQFSAATSSLLESLPTPSVGPPLAEAASPTTWTPRSVNEVIGQGKTKTVTASFTASEDLKEVVVRVVPELQPFVQVSPGSFPSIKKGQKLALNITITASEAAPLRTATGTIQLRSGNSATSVRPLPVTVEVWRSFRAGSGVTFALPSTLAHDAIEAQISTPSGSTTVVYVRTASPFQPLLGSPLITQIAFTLEPNPESLTLEQWFQRHVDPAASLLSTGVYVSQSVSNGMQALVRVRELPQDEPLAGIFAISPSGTTIVTISESQSNELDLYGYADEQERRALLLAILSTLQVQ